MNRRNGDKTPCFYRRFENARIAPFSFLKLFYNAFNISPSFYFLVFCRKRAIFLFNERFFDTFLVNKPLNFQGFFFAKAAIYFNCGRFYGV